MVILIPEVRKSLTLLGITVLAASIFTSSSKSSNSAAEEDRHYINGTSVFVKNDYTPLREKPSLQSPVVSYIDRQAISVGDILSPRRIPKGGVDNKVWIRVAQGSVSERGGWLIRADVLTPDEFRPVKIWPIKTYWNAIGQDVRSFRFTPDGHVEMLGTRYGNTDDIGKWIYYGEIQHSHGILLLVDWGNFAYYDEKTKLICDVPINDSSQSRTYQKHCRDRTTYFTDAEIKAYLKAKTEGRPLPKIDYGHVGP